MPCLYAGMRILCEQEIKPFNKFRHTGGREVSLPARLHLKRIAKITISDMAVIFQLRETGLAVSKIAPVYGLREAHLRKAIALAKEEGFEAWE